MSTKIAICGARGRMGQLLIACAKEDPSLEIVGTIGNGDDLNAVIDNTDVVMEFATHEATLSTAKVAAEHGKALVIGTTGHSEEERVEIQDAVRNVPVVWSSNFSRGVNIFFYITHIVGELLKDAKVELSETHHTKKKDAPSGTAKTLQKILEDIRGSSVPVHSFRTGEVVGDHTVAFATTDEHLELTHHAIQREVFARGALRAARWVVGKSAGIYDMQDVLGLKK